MSQNQYNAAPPTLTDGQTVNLQVSAAGRLLTDAASTITNLSALSQAGIPVGALQNRGASGNVAAASAVATLDSDPGKTTYISGFQVTGGGATAASVINVVVSGTLGGSLTYNIAVPAGAILGIVPLVVQFYPPYPASALDTDIVVTVPTFGVGNTNASVVSTGFKL